MLLLLAPAAFTLLSRSSLLRAAAAIAAPPPAAAAEPAAASSVATPSLEELDFSKVVELINTLCPAQFKRAVASSRRFLYRGEGLLQPTVLSPAPDLLELNTYGTESALRYFSCLETMLVAQGTQARPSTGHIGTSCREEGEAWGAAASIWPICVPTLAYVWPLHRRRFYPAPGQPACDGDRPGALGLDVGLARALAREHEVLFAARSFLAVPASQDGALRAALRLHGGGRNGLGGRRHFRGPRRKVCACAAAPASVACGVPVRRVWHELGAGIAPLFTLEVVYDNSKAVPVDARLATHDGLSSCFWPATRLGQTCPRPCLADSAHLPPWTISDRAGLAQAHLSAASAPWKRAVASVSPSAYDRARPSTHLTTPGGAPARRAAAHAARPARPHCPRGGLRHRAVRARCGGGRRGRGARHGRGAALALPAATGTISRIYLTPLDLL